MPPKKTDNDEHKKCLGDKTKSELSLSKSKPIWISPNTKSSKSDQRISKTEGLKASCASSETTSRNSDNKSAGDRYKSSTKREKAQGTLVNIPRNNNRNITYTTNTTNNRVNPEAWKFCMLCPKESHPIKSSYQIKVFKMTATKSPGGPTGKEPVNKADKKDCTSKPPVQQKSPAAQDPKQTVTPKSAVPIKPDTSKTAPTSVAASATAQPTTVPKPPSAQKQTTQATPSSSAPPKSTTIKTTPTASVAANPKSPDPKSSPIAQTKSPAVPTKDEKGGKAEQINLKPTQQTGKPNEIISNQGPTGKAADIASDMKIPPKIEDPQKAKATSMFSTFFKNFSSETVRGRANTMAGDSSDEAQLKGLSKYFNSQTNRGRANVAKATYAAIGVLILYYSIKPSKK